MDRKTVLQRVFAGSASLILAVFGFTGFAAAHASISTQGPNSPVSAYSSDFEKCKVTNTNNINAENNVSQNATSGHVDAYGNTSVGNWSGWNTLDPLVYQNKGIGFDSWHDDILSWMDQRDSGSGWSSAGDHLSWKPGNNSWNNLDPMLWQANGQSHDNWSSHARSHLNNNFADWEADWPPEANGVSNGLGGSGNASNNSSFVLNVNVDNSGSSVAAIEACGPSAVAKKPPKHGDKHDKHKKPRDHQEGGKVLGKSVAKARGGAVSGAGVGVGGGGGFVAAAAHQAGAGAGQHVSGPAKSVPSKDKPSHKPPKKKHHAPSISTKGPKSPVKSVSTSKSITPVKNTTNINVTNNTSQNAATGNVNSSKNTSAGGGSGNANNAGATGVSAAVKS